MKSKSKGFHVYLLLVAGLFGCFLDENRVVFAGAPAAGDCLVSDFIISSEVEKCLRL